MTLAYTYLDQTGSPPNVDFGAVAATNVTVTGTTTLTAKSPPHNPGTVDVRVDAPYVSDDLPGGWTSANSAAAWFTYCNGACSGPTVTSVTDSFAPAPGGKMVTITGHGFAGGITTVRFGSVQAITCSISDTQLSVVVPPAVNDQAGQVSVTVTNATGPSNGVPFTYTPDPLAGNRLTTTGTPSRSAVQILSHELVESATDPLIGLGWINNRDFSLRDPFGVLHTGEASDICEADANQSTSVAGSVLVDTYPSRTRLVQ